MDWLEEELKQALTRKEPPAGFANRVTSSARKPRLFAMPRWLPAAAAIVVMMGGGAAMAAAGVFGFIRRRAAA